MPAQCPVCGRFLSKALVEGLLAAPASCPRCDAPLTADQFNERDAREPTTAAGSVRPPDLAPSDVWGRDVLAGWDRTAEVGSRVAQPLGASAAIIGAGVLGGIVGGLALPRHRSVGAVAGTLLGAVLAIAGARVLEIPEVR